MSKLRRAFRLVGGALIAAGLVWGSGFVWFIHYATRPVAPPPVADGIVALTGGADRVETALHLLQAHQARWLLLSGIGGGADLAALARLAGVNPAPLAGRVTLGRQATSTSGNATETAAWVRAHDIQSLIIVTAFYHMPRALTELRRVLPNVKLYPDPVLEPQPGTLGKVVTLRLMAGEYSKYLLSLTGITDLLPQRELPDQRATPSR